MTEIFPEYLDIAVPICLISAPCRDFSCIGSHSTPECDEAFSTYLSTPLHVTPNSPKFQTLPKIVKVVHVEQI